MLAQSLRMAVKSIAGNKMRSFLTILGIIIGVIAVVVLVAIGQGANSSVSSSIESLGTNLLTVNIMGARDSSVTMDELYQLAADNDSISAIAPAITQSATTKAGDNEYTDGSIIGTIPGYDTIRNLTVASGRFLKQPDIDNRSYVAVIGTDVADELFDSRNVIGNTFRMDGYDFTVIGLLEEEGSSTSGSNDNKIIIPFTLAERIFFTPGISTFYASASSSADVSMAEAVLTNYMDQKFAAVTTSNTFSGSDTSNDNYKIYNQTDMLDTLDSAMSTLTLMLGGIAAISLLVGGIGIMNIMLVSVSERTREIGIRKAIGAKRRNILTQFLIEALVVCLLGGVLGLIISFGIMEILSPLLDMTLTLSAGIAELAIGFSLVIGLIFGLYPANKASKLHPIEALRYDG
ncbi:MAG: ABC transporter permease [Bacillota bacterium]